MMRRGKSQYADDIARRKIKASFDNLVIVRIWPAQSYTKGEPGHVSCEIPAHQIYASLWPASPVNAASIITSPQIVKIVWNSLASDLVAEHKDAPLKFHFFSLNIDAMKQCYEDKKRNLVGWTLGARSSRVQANTDNCTSLVYSLLIAGGLNTLCAAKFLHRASTASQASSADWVPDQLAKYLPLAVSAERQQYQQSVDFEQRACKTGALGIQLIQPEVLNLETSMAPQVPTKTFNTLHWLCLLSTPILLGLLIYYFTGLASSETQNHRPNLH